MLLRVAVVCAGIFGAGLLAAVPTIAEELGPEQERPEGNISLREKP